MPQKGPIVLITGASQGIGEAIALVFAEKLQGARLALVSRRRTQLERVASRCLSRGAAEALAFPCDVSDAKDVGLLLQAVLGKLGVPDVLVNNAGSFKPAPLLETTVEQFDAAIAANLRSVFLVTRAFAPRMVRRRRGDIFNMGSVAGLQAYPGGAAYCAAKFGVTGLGKVLRAELKGTRVRVCNVYPGATWSPSWAGSGVTPSRMMRARDVAEAFFAVYSLNRRAVVEEIVLRPDKGDL